MRLRRSRIEEIKEAWAREGDEQVRKAVLENWKGYSQEAQFIIKEEVLRRKLQLGGN